MVIVLFCILSVCEATNEVLLSRNKPTYAANVYVLNGIHFNSSLAVDGNYDGNVYHYSVYHSLGTNVDKWWLVILDSVSVVTRIVIYSRTDGNIERSSNLSIFASYGIQTTFSNSSFYQVQYYPGPPPSGEIITTIPTNRVVARTIAITKPYGQEVINVAEVEIFGFSFVKSQSMVYKIGSSSLYPSVAPIAISSGNIIECSVFCFTNSNCVSFSRNVNGECVFYNHAGGNIVPGDVQE